jgi:hemin uptake protein HemP
VSNDPHERPRVSEPPDEQPTEVREIDSQQLMQGSREIVIRHGTEAYRLSVTRSGKLILRK